MSKHLALLRGINVSGQKIIKMEILREVFRSMKFSHVTTYIQSGNVIFESKEVDQVKLTSQIEKTLHKSFGYEVPTLLRTGKEIENIIKHNPFNHIEIDKDNALYVSFLRNAPDDKQTQLIQSFSNEVDQLIIIDKELYWLCHKTKGKSIVTNNWIEKKLGMQATMRNWRTVNQLLTYF